IAVEVGEPTSNNKAIGLLEVDLLFSLLFLLSLDLDVLGFSNTFDFFDPFDPANRQANIFPIF
ncbi:25864_t:CDS:1, partial [Gigaspora margarita]